MAKQPRWYQSDAISAWWSDCVARQGNPLLVLPTGAGKSLVLAELIRSIMNKYPRQKILVMTHVAELIIQDLDAVIDQWPYAPVGIYSAGVGQKTLDKSVIIAGVQSLVKVPVEELPRFDLLFVDEAQLISPDATTSYRLVIDRLLAKNPKLKVTGLTATPYRLKGGHLLDCGLFTHIAYDLTTPEAFARLVSEGFLSRLVTKRTQTKLDTSGVGERGGEFIESELNAAVERQHDVTTTAISEMIAMRRNYNLVFATSVTHAYEIADILKLRGEQVEVIHGGIGKKERTRILTDFKQKRLKWLINVNVLTTGFDAPHVDLLGILRPSKSVGLWVQILGRGLRVCQGKTDCLVMDFTSNTTKLGPIDDPAVPSRGKKKKKGGTGAIVAAKFCKGTMPTGVKCERVCGCSCRKCPDCGYEFDMNDPEVFGRASEEDVMGTGEPVVNDHSVTMVNYSLFQRDGKPDSIKVIYYVGLEFYYAWLNPEIQGPARKLYEAWWKRASGGTEPPMDCTEFIQRRSELSQPAQIKVWHKKPYPQILNYNYGDGFEGVK